MTPFEITTSNREKPFPDLTFRVATSDFQNSRSASRGMTHCLQAVVLTSDNSSLRARAGGPGLVALLLNCY